MVINLHGHLTNYIESRRPLSHATVPPDQLSQKDEQIIYNSIVFYHNESAKGNYVYGFTQLSKVAVKALSHGINDPGVARLCYNTSAVCLWNYITSKNGEYLLIRREMYG
jgi:uncharacterized membrane protein